MQEGCVFEERIKVLELESDLTCVLEGVGELSLLDLEGKAWLVIGLAYEEICKKQNSRNWRCRLPDGGSQVRKYGRTEETCLSILLQIS